MSVVRIGSLCSGYGGLDLAVLDVLGGEVAWFADPDPGASAILAHAWPGVPNLGDIRAVDFRAVPRVDVVTAGFPCQDLTLSGMRAGLGAGTRSGVWMHVARAVGELRPRLLVMENVEGICSAPADRGVGAGEQDVADAGPDALRALGRVLGDLADMGWDAEWCRVGAWEVGAPHRRNRIFALAWPGGLGPGFGAGRDAAPDAGHGNDAERARPAGRAAGERAAKREELGGGVAGSVWGAYASAVAWWERVTGRAAPRAVDDRGLLAPACVEWLMGLREGHVTGAPGLTRTAQLHALGNGVLPAQAAAAIRLLLERCADAGS